MQQCERIVDLRDLNAKSREIDATLDVLKETRLWKNDKGRRRIESEDII